MESDILNRTLNLAVSIQQIPAPTFAESQRAEFIHTRFEAAGLIDVERDEMDNVYGRLPGKGEKPPIVVSAHSDTVFPAGTDLSVVRNAETIAGPGIGDNSLGIAGLLALVWTIQERAIMLPGDLWLVSNVGEEGLGNLRGMRAVVRRFGGTPLAYIVLEGMALGQIYHRGLSVKRYRITAYTSGGHPWVNRGNPSAIHELAALVKNLDELSMSSKPRSTLNIGVFSGGTSVNTIASEAYLELDLRSEVGDSLDRLAHRVKTLVKKSERTGIKFAVEDIGERPAGKIPPDHHLVQVVVAALEEQGIRPQLGVASTDANVPLSLGIPAVSIGLTTGGQAHTAEEYIHIAPLAQGMEQLVAVVAGVFRALD
jgi:acetylornithine deacetylase/succinyl-diaminopimelate desuccinylase-like protein